MKLPICELFVSTQMEGCCVGIPSIFLRVSGCNLTCCFKNSICDTPYASFNPEKSIYKSMDELIEAFKKIRKEYPNVHHLVITGGEPLLYKDALEAFLKEITTEDLVTTIETNGTLPPMENDLISLYSISPKLSTSMCLETAKDKLTQKQIDHHNKTRINIENLSKYLFIPYVDVQLKFVYSGKECISEIDDILNRIAIHQTYMLYQECLNYLNSLVMLMPEGYDEGTLKKSRIECVNKCIERGWRYTDRLHIIVWGNKRGV